jgi:TatD DNase family protein
MTKDESRIQTEADTSSFDIRHSSLVDTHCHLDWRTFDADRDEVVRRAVEAGVTRMVTIGVNVASSRRAVELAEQYAEVYAAVGVHPNDSAGFSRETLGEIRTLAAHPKVVAVGEIGLDYFWKKVEPDRQSQAFIAQLELAAEIGKPVIIHNRDATDDVLTVLARHLTHHVSRMTPGVLHSFFDSIEVAQRAFELGFLIGFTGPITFKKSSGLREVARVAPADRLVIETDAPFLTPEPRRGRRNEPAYVKTIAEQVAWARHTSIDAIARQTSANARRLFGWANDYGASSH